MKEVCASFNLLRLALARDVQLAFNSIVTRYVEMSISDGMVIRKSK
jgi:hypothetical protein